MKQFLTLLGVLFSIYGMAQTTNKSYIASTAIFPNPNRGFYKFTSASSSGTYSGLNQTTLTSFRQSNNITLIYREFRLEAFINSPISAAYLTNMQSDFDKIRNAGLKAIIRFTYSNSESASQRDASKATILSHLLQLKPLLQANVDVISVMQAGFIGVWGEWYYTSQADFGGGGYNGSSLTTTNINNRRDVVEAMLNALPSSRMIQLRTPAFKRAMYSTTALLDSQGFSGTNPARIGHYNDCFLASSDDYGTYVNTTIEYPYLAQETKFVPMGGETCALNSPRSDCASALLEMAKFHWSFLNLDYNLDVINGFQTNSCFTDIQKKLGYRFELTTATFPQAVSLGTPLSLTIKLKNVGFATPFNEVHAYIVLKNTNTNQTFPILMNTDPRLWVGPNELTLSENLTLPNTLTTGTYQMYLYLPDNSASIANRPEYAIRFANESVWDSATGYNNLNHTLNVTNSTLGTADNSKLNLTIYPVPTDNELTIELEGINEYKVSVYNSIGQKIDVRNTVEATKMSIDTQNLSTGLYFVEFVKGATRETRKIIVRH